MSEKQIKAAVKEGGKKGVDVAGMADMGGVAYFHVKIDSVKGDLALLEKVMEGANAEVDPAAEERKGGAGHLGKVLFSANDDQVVYICNVPKALAEDKGLTAKEWSDTLTDAIGGEVVSDDGEMIKVVAKKDAEKDRFPLKMVESIITAGCALLRKRNLLPDESESDDDYNPGDVAEEVGIEW